MFRDYVIENWKDEREFEGSEKGRLDRIVAALKAIIVRVVYVFVCVCMYVCIYVYVCVAALSCWNELWRLEEEVIIDFFFFFFFCCYR